MQADSEVIFQPLKRNVLPGKLRYTSGVLIELLCRMVPSGAEKIGFPLLVKVPHLPSEIGPAIAIAAVKSRLNRKTSIMSLKINGMATNAIDLEVISCFLLFSRPIAAVQSAVLDGLGQVGDSQMLGAFQVGNRARHL